MPSKKKVSIVIDAVDKATRPVRKINKALERMKRPIQKLRFQFRALARESGLGKLAARMKRFAIVGVAALGGLGLAMKKFIGTADSIAKTAGALGIATDAFQELAFAADRSGVDAGTFASSMKALTKRLGEAKAGTGALVTFLKKTDPALLASLKATSSTEEAFGLLADAAAKIEDPMKRAALTSAAFSRAGLGMSNVLKLGRKGVDKLRTSARNLGLVMDKETLAAAEETQDRFTDLGAVLKGLAFRIGGAMLPAVRDITEGILAWTRENRKFLNQDLPRYVTAVVDAMRGVFHVAQAAVRGVAALVDAFGGLRTVMIAAAGFMAIKLTLAIAAALPAIWAFNAALFANPIGLIILGITALAVAASVLIAKWEPAAKFFANLWELLQLVIGFRIPSFGFGGAEPVVPAVAAAGAGGGGPAGEPPGDFFGLGSRPSRAGAEGAAGAPAGAPSDLFGLGSRPSRGSVAGPERGGRRGLDEIRAFLRIVIDAEGRPLVQQLESEPGFDLDVDLGPSMAG